MDESLVDLCEHFPGIPGGAPGVQLLPYGTHTYLTLLTIVRLLSRMTQQQHVRASTSCMPVSTWYCPPF